MKQMKLGRCQKALLAFASVALLTPAVHAQTVTPSIGDLMLGFRTPTSGSQGQTLNLEIDLGNMSVFYNATNGQVVNLPQLNVADLVSTYGADWASRTDLFWGAVATTGRSVGTPDGHAPVDTLWGTAPNCDAAFKRKSTAAQATASSYIEPMFIAGDAGSLYGATDTGDSTNAAVINNSLPGSWSVQEAHTAGLSFGFFNPMIDNYEGDATVVSQLYELQPTNVVGVSATFLGNLVLTGSGLTFVGASPTEAVCKNSIVLQANAISCTATCAVEDIDGGSTGYCLAISLSSEGPFNVGTTNIDLIAESGNGQVSTCTATVVVEAGAPVVSSTSNISQCEPVASWSLPTAVGCNTPIGAVVCVPASGSTFTVGTTPVVCTATDAASKIGTNSFTVTISSTVPTISSVSAISQCEPVVVYTTPTATDCAGSNVVVTCSPVSGSTFAVGTTNVTCSATDSASRTGHSSFSVTISSTAPTIVGGSAIVTNLASASATNIVINYTTPTATDCAGSNVVVTCSPASGSTFAVGTTNVTCTATDSASRTAHSSFSVTVTGAGISGITSQIAGLSTNKVLTEIRKVSLINTLNVAQSDLTKEATYLATEATDLAKDTRTGTNQANVASIHASGEVRASCAELSGALIKIKVYGETGIISSNEAATLMGAIVAEQTSLGCPTP
jgi:hypothetical protein